MKKRFVSMLLALAMCMGLAVPGFAAEPEVEGKVISSNFDVNTNTLTIETAEEIIEVTITEEDGVVVLRQYNNGVLTETIVNECQAERMNEINSTRASGRFMGTVHYTGGMNPTYTMDVDVFDRHSLAGTTTYTPPDGVLTMAKFINAILTNFPVSAAVAAIIGEGIVNVAGAVTGGIVYWLEKKNPVLSCKRYDYTAYFIHHGTSPRYYDGEEIVRTGCKYVVDDIAYPDRYNEEYCEGMVIQKTDAKTAMDIYYSLYSYPQWEYLGWTQ